MSLRTLPGRPRSRRQRWGLTLSAAVLPLTLAACGSTASTTDAGGSNKAASNPSADITGAYANLMKAKSATFTLSLDDKDGNLKKAAADGKDGVSGPAADALVGGTVSMTIDPTGDLTLGDLSNADPGGSVQDSLSKVNYSLDVKTGGDDLVGVRLVDGILYAKVDLGTIDRIAKDSGSDPVSPSLDQAGQQLPELGKAIGDLKDGKWLKIDLAPFVGQLEGLAGGAGASGMPQLDGQKIANDLLAAVKPYSTVTGGKDGVYDVEVQAKQAIQAVVPVFQDLLGKVGGAALPTQGLSDLDVSSLQDGKLRGTVELDGDSLSKVTLDLGSINAVAPAADQSPDLSGSKVVLDIKDDADKVGSPDNVSDVDVNALVQTFLGGILGGAGSSGGGSAEAPTPS